MSDTIRTGTQSARRCRKLRPAFDDEMALEGRLLLSGGLTTLANFDGSDGANPKASLVFDAAGDLFGTTYGGGADKDGTVFEIAAGGGGAINTLTSFTNTDGANPQAPLVLDAADNLYGTTELGGAFVDGTVFEIAAGGGGAFKTLTSFDGLDGTDGQVPEGNLVLDAKGNLYGTTEAGGAGYSGTVFEIPASGGILNTFASFNFTDGAEPQAGLVLDAAGNLYGTAYNGGADYDGTVFEIAAGGGGAIKLLASFSGSDGANPSAGLVLDAAGNLYGTTSAGGPDGDGTVFEIAAGSNTISMIASFTGSDGADPTGGLVLDSAGNLYGTTYAGGADKDGTVFEIAAGSNGQITTLTGFNGTDGANPDAGLVLDTAGNLYGTTMKGGANSDGTVFEFAINPLSAASTNTTINSSANPSAFGTSVTFTATVTPNLTSSLTPTGTVEFFDGATELGPAGGSTLNIAGKAAYTASALTVGSHSITAVYSGDSNFEGSTSSALDQSITKAGTTTTVVSSVAPSVFGEWVTFTATVTPAGTGLPVPTGTVEFFDGSAELGPGTLNGAGQWTYTTTSALTVGNHSITVVYSGDSDFSTSTSSMLDQSVNALGPDLVALTSFNGTDGELTFAGLVRDAKGDLYGTTDGGGVHTAGTVFEIPAGSDTITTLASFDVSDGEGPEASLLLDAAGNLFGTTVNGGAHGYGTVFEIAAGGDTITTLASFNGGDGLSPSAGLVLDAAGNLYGTTLGSFGDGYGTVFEIAAGSDAITTLASFNGSDGANPLAGLVLDTAGNLYGTATEGGADGGGTAFEIAKGSDAITTLASFNGGDGAYPSGLVLDTAGNLYGATAEGGADGAGTVFEIAAGSDAITTLASFNGGDGAHPIAGLVFDAAGNLYGTAYYGGTDDDGAVFEVAVGSDTITTLASFNGTDGENPNAGLVLDTAGNLYGTTVFGGADGDGTVFELVQNKLATAATIESSANPSTFGQSVTFTATVTPSGSPDITPTGKVEFLDGSTELGRGTLDSAGQATFSTSSLGVSSHSITAFYSGDLDFLTSTSSALGQSVSAAATTTMVASSANPAVDGEEVTFTATVANDDTAAVPAGTVEFTLVSAAGTQYMGPVTLIGGTAKSPQLVLSSADGPYTVEANFTDPAGNLIASSAALAGGQVVNPVTAQYLQDVLDSTPTPTLTATTDADLQTIIAAINGLSAQGTSVTITVDLGSGTFGDSTFSPPAGVTVIVTGNGSTTTIVGHSPAIQVTQGDVILSDVTFTTATDAPTILVSGGSLALLDDVIDESTGYTDAAIDVMGGELHLGTDDDPGGDTLNINGLGEFVHNTTGNSVPTVGDTFEINGVAVPEPYLSFTALSTSKTSSVYGQPLTLTAAVVANTPSTGTLGGSVDFFDTTTNTDLGSVPVVDGTAALSTTDFGAGEHVIFAYYSGGGNFTLSLDSLIQTITPARLTVTAVLSTTDIGHGGTVPTPTVSYSGLVNGDNAGVVTGSAGFIGLPTTSSPAGVYTVTPTTTGLSASDYVFANVVSATLNIHPVVTNILVEWGSESMSILNLSRDLPFSDITGFKVEFSDPVNISGTGLTLTSTASGPNYAPGKSGSGQGVTSQTWTLPTAIGIDRLMLALDQANTVATGATSLTLFGLASQSFSVLPGDFNGDGVVSSADVTDINNATVGAYDVWADLLGTGTVNINDVKLARSKIGTSLPPLD